MEPPCPPPPQPPDSQGPPPQLLPVSYSPNQPELPPTFSGVPMNNTAMSQSSNIPTDQTGRGRNFYPGQRQPWSTGLCDCCKDPKSSCGVSGTLYALLLWVFGCSCMYSCVYRTKLRGQYFLEEKPCIDCCVHCWCETCSLCQEYRELQNRGFNLSIGLSYPLSNHNIWPAAALMFDPPRNISINYIYHKPSQFIFFFDYKGGPLA
ncbi:hypothetical protein CRG98_019145 [Punica granatum]|uniref:Uncharacterized protein n=1 Tax=Punica granatum TaxID=22663 RepID=A0A2I0JW23_PUNGR|nr:hypothetical protein CRG98_019145 [Punica granatum]